MGVKVYEGVVTRTSNGTIRNGRLTHYEFIEIGGERVMNVQADNLLDTFITVGDNIAISCQKGWGAGHKVIAVREPDGRITKTELSVFIFASLFMFGCGVVIALIPMIFAFVIIPPILALLLWAGIAGGIAYLTTKDLYKARNALDARPAATSVSN